MAIFSHPGVGVWARPGAIQYQRRGIPGCRRGAHSARHVPNIGNGNGDLSLVVGR